MFAMAQGEHSGCVASVAEGKTCPPEGNILDSINFHANSFKKISTAILDLAALPGLLTVIIGLSLLLAIKVAGLVREGVILSIRAPQRVYEEAHYAVATSPTRSWIIRHVNSPSAG